MMGSFVRDCLLPGLGMCAGITLVVGFVAWLAHVINSIARSAAEAQKVMQPVIAIEQAAAEVRAKMAEATA